jgi:GntR family transcriptional regulator
MSKRLTFVSFSQEVLERGMTPSSKIVSAIKTTANDLAIAESLNISVGDEVYKIERVRFADKIPMAL